MSENKAAVPGPVQHVSVPRCAGEEPCRDPGDGKQEASREDAASDLCFWVFPLLSLPLVPFIQATPGDTSVFQRLCTNATVRSCYCRDDRRGAKKPDVMFSSGVDYNEIGSIKKII